MATISIHRTSAEISEDLIESNLIWRYPEQSNLPTGSLESSKEENLYKSLNNFYWNIGSNKENYFEKPETPSNVKRKIFNGQVENIFDSYALVVFEIENSFVERKISLDRLIQIKADSEGANINLEIFENEDGSVLSRIVKAHDEPYDSHPDENLIHTLANLKRNSS